MSDPIGKALANLGNERVLDAQKILNPANLPAPVILALGYRETGMTNEEGGARWDSAQHKWVAAKTDTGFCQISREYNLPALKGMIGCPAGTWTPAPGHTAAEPGYCPRFADSVHFIVKEFSAAIRFAVSQRRIRQDDYMRFAVAAHNAGIQGAFEGYKAGDVDSHTAHGDYSKAIMADAELIQAWLLAHPHWVA